MNRTRLILLCALSLGCVCKLPSVPEERANFVLHVSNQGPAIPVVDITVWIDGRLAIDGDYEVGDQHNFEVLHLRLRPGSHTLRAKSARGGAELVTEFELPGKRWAGLNFWAPTPEPGEAPEGRFSFSVSEEPTYME